MLESVVISFANSSSAASKPQLQGKLGVLLPVNSLVCQLPNASASLQTGMLLIPGAVMSASWIADRVSVLLASANVPPFLFPLAANELTPLKIRQLSAFQKTFQN
jgi:hypothetical protein